MENELATANETGTHPSVIEKNLNGSISNKHVKIGNFGPNHFQSSFSVQKSKNDVNHNNPNDISLDAISMAGSYVAKSKL